MNVKFAVLADHASITREGKLNVLGIFDIINAPSLPMGLPLFYVVVSYEVGSAEFDTKKNIDLVLCDEDGNRIMSLKQELNIGRPPIRGTLLTTNQIAGIVGCQFTKAGSYQFDILVNGDSKKTIPLRVNQITLGKEGK